jgi:hypothetical protein
MKKQVSADQLRYGVYVNELDRPWTQTPFMYQGFVGNSEAQLEALKKYCKTVIIDTVKGSDVALLQVMGGGVRMSSMLDTIQQHASYPEKSTVTAELGAARQVQKQAALALTDVFGSVKAGKVLDAPRVREAVSSMTDSVVRNPDAMLLLSMMKNAGTDTLNRAMGVSIFTEGECRN